jgi:hypothetical protein
MALLQRQPAIGRSKEIPMKHAHILGLALGIAAVLAVLAGAGAASATVLCKATETPCSEANRLAKSAEIAADLTPATSVRFEHTTGLLHVSCSGSAFAATVEKPGGASETTFISVPSSGLTWSGCTSGVSTTSSGEWEIHYKEGTDNGTVTDNSNPFGKRFGVTIGECSFALPLGAHIGVLTGKAGKAGEWSLAPILEIHTRLALTKGPPTCLEDVIWIATYSITKPAPLYVRAS